MKKITLDYVMKHIYNCPAGPTKKSQSMCCATIQTHSQACVSWLIYTASMADSYEPLLQSTAATGAGAKYMKCGKKSVVYNVCPSKCQCWKLPKPNKPLSNQLKSTKVFPWPQDGYHWSTSLVSVQLREDLLKIAAKSVFKQVLQCRSDTLMGVVLNAK
jgi:hypothetical protein